MALAQDDFERASLGADWTAHTIGSTDATISSDYAKSGTKSMKTTNAQEYPCNATRYQMSSGTFWTWIRTPTNFSQFILYTGATQFGTLLGGIYGDKPTNFLFVYGVNQYDTGVATSTNTWYKYKIIYDKSQTNEELDFYVYDADSVEVVSGTNYQAGAQDADVEWTRYGNSNVGGNAYWDLSATMQAEVVKKYHMVDRNHFIDKDRFQDFVDENHFIDGTLNKK